MTHAVPFFNYPFVYKQHAADYDRIFRDVCSRGAFIQQTELTEFESLLAKVSGAKFALGVANGTDALVMGLVAAGIGSMGGGKADDEVIFCSHTFVATAASIHHAGAVPVPCEVGTDHLIDPQSVRAKISSRTRAIMPTQLNGCVCNMDELERIAAEHGLKIIEDSAQGLGATYKGRGAGSFGFAGTVSFYPAKNLGCFGDGGAVLTNDAATLERLTVFRDHGRSAKLGEVVTWGYNSRLDNLQAAILLFKLQRYDDEVAHRRQVAAQYRERLAGLESRGLISLPRGPHREGLHGSGDYFDVFQNYECQVTHRDELRSHLTERGIGTLIQWGGKAVHQFKGLGLATSLPNTDRFFERCIMLPMNSSLSETDISYVCETITAFYSR